MFTILFCYCSPYRLQVNDFFLINNIKLFVGYNNSWFRNAFIRPSRKTVNPHLYCKYSRLLLFLQTSYFYSRSDSIPYSFMCTLLLIPCVLDGGTHAAWSARVGQLDLGLFFRWSFISCLDRFAYVYYKNSCLRFINVVSTRVN